MFVVLCLLPSLASSQSFGQKNWRTNLYGSPQKPALGPNGTIYLREGFYEGTLTAINPDGTLRWRENLPSNRNSGGATIRPDGSIILSDGNSGKVFAYDADQTKLWEFDTGDNGKVREAALAEDGTIYVPTRDGVFFALSPDGEEMWRLDLSSNQTMYTGPVIARDGTIYLPTGMTNGSRNAGRLYAINPDGSVKWTYDTEHMIRTAPAIASDGTVYVTEHGYTIYAINPDGTKKWTYTTQNKIKGSGIVLGPEGTVYFGNSGTNIYALNPDGTRKWVYNVSGRNMIGRYTGTVGEDGTIYFGTQSFWGGSLLALNPDGTLKWKESPNARVSQPPLLFEGSLVQTTDYNRYGMVSYNIEGKGLANSSWPSYQHDNRNTGRAISRCNLKPEVKLFPQFLRPRFGSTFLFITGFKESDKESVSIDPSTVKLAGAKAERWHALPPFLLLKYKNENLDVGKTSPGGFAFFEQAELSIEGSLKTRGCFQVTKKTYVWP